MGSMGRNVWIDTDAGTDDAQAILMALASPAINVCGISAVRGNTSCNQVVHNILRLLRVADRMEIPVYKGCKEALLGSQGNGSIYHGLDGFGDVPDGIPINMNLVKPEHAVNALVREMNKSPGDITLVCLGPLTNVAMALRLDPKFGKKLNACYIMGGNYEGRGNVTMTAEFNFYADAEAARVVLNELQAPITMACWELCLNYSLPWNWYTEIFSAVPTPKGCFIKSINAKCMATYYHNSPLEDVEYEVADQLIMAICLNSTIIKKSKLVYCTVELRGGETRGQMICDWANLTKQVPNATIVTDVDTEMLKDMMIDSLK